MANDTLPLREWERQIARDRAAAMCARAAVLMEAGDWGASDLARAARAAERRLTRAQRAEFWMAIVADSALAALDQASRG